METRSIDKGFTWQYASFQYRHNYEEWDENMYYKLTTNHCIFCG
jgi:hypothetical protein